MLVHNYFTSEEYAALSPRALKAMIDLLVQFRGANNGDLCAAWSLMRKLGWTSKDQLAKALTELKERGWIIVSRQGGRRIPTLYALTILRVDPCNGKLDIAATRTPLHLWRNGRDSVISLPRSAGQPPPPHGAKQEEPSHL